MNLFDVGVSPEEVLAHPRHQAAQTALAELIAQLRACENVKDGYEFQNALLEQRLAVDADLNAFSWAVKRMKDGKQPQAGAPEPQSGLDSGRAETWQLELDVCERVARQLRCVGDALAWRVFGFERRYILALCRNQPPGVMAGKAGLTAERERVEQAWKEDGRFALLHDLTNCLRIGDITVFGDGASETIEVKTDPRRRALAQRRRISTAQRAIRDLGPLPGDNPGERLCDLDVAFKTHLPLLAAGTERAARDGIFVAKVAGDRALMVADLYGISAQGWTQAEFGERLRRAKSTVLRRAGIGGDPEYHVSATSLDLVSRDPLRVPLAAYPLHPVACARLIGDIAVFAVTTSGPALADALNRAGINARWVRSPSTEDLAAGEVLMEMRSKAVSPLHGTIVAELSRTLQMRRSELDRYLIEMIEQATWIEGIRFLMTGRALMPRQPWPYYRGEHEVWV